MGAVILAAGQGKRMKSDLPKVLHPIGGRPMVAHVIDAVKTLSPRRVIVVVGYMAERVEEACAQQGVEFVLQAQQLGTGHAVMQAEALLEGFDGLLLVLNGDVPGLRPATLAALVRDHGESGAAATVLTAEVDDPSGYGRIVRGPGGELERIVEHKDATAAERAIREINSGLFCFDARSLFAVLEATGRDNVQREYYLTDAIALLKNTCARVRAHLVADSREVAGVNDPRELEAVRRFIEGAKK